MTVDSFLMDENEEEALLFANKAASISVTKNGAALSSPYRDQIK